MLPDAAAVLRHLPIVDEPSSPTGCRLATYLLRGCRGLTDDPHDRGRTFVLVMLHGVRLRHPGGAWEVVPLGECLRAAVRGAGKHWRAA